MKSRKMTPFQQNPFCSISQGDFGYNPSPIVRLIMKLSDIRKLKLKSQGNQDALSTFCSTFAHCSTFSGWSLNLFQFRLRSHHRLRKSTGKSNTNFYQEILHSQSTEAIMGSCSCFYCYCGCFYCFCCLKDTFYFSFDFNKLYWDRLYPTGWNFNCTNLY